jgi:phenylacetate-coenzyme A ligase PaaK-like adenylate-forming protein
MIPAPGEIFSISDEQHFISLALGVFHWQSQNNPVYHSYLELLGKDPHAITGLHDIPFLPVSFFKFHEVITPDEKNKQEESLVFTSSGTTGSPVSRHIVTDAGLYRQSLLNGFRHFYGPPRDYCFVALLPSTLERKDSSLVFMVQELIRNGNHPQSGFFLHHHEDLAKILETVEKQKQKTILLGVSYALLDFAERYPMKLKHTLVMETGGMKGRRKEITRQELHTLLKRAFVVSHIHSEYGMTELLSQAYSKGDGIFECPPWMKVLIRDRYDPFWPVPMGQAGGINIIDLANINSCSFIETEDLGRILPSGNFEVLGRLEQSEIRGCNLMAE